MHKKKITLKNIATRLNVSIAVVSAALNNRTDKIRVSKDVKEKIIALADELNYRPNSLARSLKTGKTYTIGLLVSDISNHYYSKLARGVEDAANKSGYNVVFCSSDENVEKETKLIHIFRERKVDGIILSGTQQNDGLIQLLENEKYPLVLIDRDYANSKAPFVGLENQNKYGAYKVVRHLIENDFKKIALITAYSYLQPMRLREEGYKEALKDCNLSFNPDLRLEIAYSDVYNSIKNKIENLVNSGAEIDAIFTLNNKLALHCLKVLHDLGKLIPDDMGFASFDDHEMFGFNKPEITAVSHCPMEVGAKAVALLLNEMIQTSETKIKEVIPAKLIIRKSSLKTNKN